MKNDIVTQYGSFAHGAYTTASGQASHAEGVGTVANHLAQNVSGMYNIPDPASTTDDQRGTYIEIVGNGTASTLSNARTLDWEGNEKISGNLTINAGSANEVTITPELLNNAGNSNSGEGSNLKYVKDIPGYTYTTIETITWDIDPNADLASDEIYEAYHTVLNWDQEKLRNFINTWCTDEREDYFHSVIPLYLEREGSLIQFQIIAYKDHLGMQFLDYIFGETILDFSYNTDHVETSGRCIYQIGAISTRIKQIEINLEGTNNAVIINNIIDNKASGLYSLAEGNNNTASGKSSHAEGNGNTASGQNSHVEGNGNIASGQNSHAEGDSNTASGQNSHVEGTQTEASGGDAHAEGNRTLAAGVGSHAEGYWTITSGKNSHAEGYNTYTSGDYSHAEGSATTASGETAHAEGWETLASGKYAHAEGSLTTASGRSSHAEGNDTLASGDYSRASGFATTASGNYSYGEGYNVIANHRSQHVFGEYNIPDSSITSTTQKGTYIEIIGNGTTTAALSNARTLDWAGNEQIAGNLTLGMGTTAQVTITPQQLTALLATLN